jgi:hypothetical protein
MENNEYRKVNIADVTVIVTVYEPPVGFMNAMRSLQTNKAQKVFIIADSTCHRMVQELLDQAKFSRNIFTVVCEHKPGT